MGTEPAPTPARAAINGAVEAFTVAAARDLADSIRTAVLRIVPDNEPIDEDTTAPLDFDDALLGLVDGSTDTRSGLIFPTRMRVSVPSH
ncbi:hypothetical protein I1A62_32440 [Rhodococcus sp. USK10]|uniref:hypothetical protein n=1 Tax=Rhodococcus sp. USK10 TaxID=2789739 RepID=UPI001C5DC4F1|nr:hypothetical protein [Rhodococcus sp. USK10]QYB01912.1 hypothetical protein I1A62_32440 [Rhodococcus sp. USK10]